MLFFCVGGGGVVSFFLVPLFFLEFLFLFFLLHGEERREGDGRQVDWKQLTPEDVPPHPHDGARPDARQEPLPRARYPVHVEEVVGLDGPEAVLDRRGAGVGSRRRRRRRLRVAVGARLLLVVVRYAVENLVHLRLLHVRRRLRGPGRRAPEPRWRRAVVAAVAAVVVGSLRHC